MNNRRLLGISLAIILVLGFVSPMLNGIRRAYAVTLPDPPTFNASGGGSCPGSNCVDIADDPSRHLTRFSVAAWFKTSTNYAGNAIIANRGGFGSDTAGQNMNYGLWMDVNEKIVGGYEAGSNGADLFVVSPNSYSDGGWHYAAVTYDGSVVRLYVDGAQVGTRSSTSAPDVAGNQPLRIGANSLKTTSNSYNWLFFTGEIDDVRVWNNPLSSSEITNEFNNGVYNPAGLLVYFNGTLVTFPSPANQAPIADAGPDQTKDEGMVVTLNGSSSSDPDNGPQSLGYSWQQVSGPSATLSSSTVPSPTFTAPSVASGSAVLQFKLTVNDGADSSTIDTVDITVNHVELPGGNYNYAPSFNSNQTSFYTVNNSAKLALQQFSLAAWFKTSNSYTTQPAFIVDRGGLGNSGINLNYGIWIAYKSPNINKISAGFQDSAGKTYYVYSTKPYMDYGLANGGWHYVVATFSGSQVKLYIDGVLDNTNFSAAATPDSAGNKPLRIGADSQYTGSSRQSPFFGQIDEVRVWNRAISQTEVTSLYNSNAANSNGQIFYMNGTNGSPIAIAGANQNVQINAPVTLSGSSSYDPDNNQLTYFWKQISGSPQVSLSNPNAAVTTFTSPNVAFTTDFQFSLTVNDGTVNSTDTTIVTVSNNVGGYHFAPSYPLGGKQYFEVNDGAASAGRASFTVGVWFKTTVKPTTNAFLVTKGGLDSGTNMNYGIWLNNGAKLVGGFESTSGTNRFTVATTQSYNDGNWHYAVLTYDGTILKLYVDGDKEIKQPSGGSSKPDSSGSSNVRLGAHGTTDDKFYTGDVDELRIWSIALTATNIKDQFYSGIYSPTNLVYQTHMDDVPKSNTGALQIIPGNTQVILNGTLSSGDSNNGPLSYSWGGPVPITNNNQQVANTTIPAPASGNGEKDFFPSASPAFSSCVAISNVPQCFILKVTDSKYTAVDIAPLVSYDGASSSVVLKTPFHATASEPKYEDELLASIGSATSHVYASMYFICVDTCSGTLTYNNAVINALATRHQQVPNLDVRLIFPTQTIEQYTDATHSVIAELESKGFVNATKTPSCMGLCYKVKSTHAKVVEVDDNAAYVGSANWNDMGLDNNWELTLKATNQFMVKDAKNYILNQWGAGNPRPSNAYYYERFVSGTQYNNYLLDSLKTAKNVKALMFEITRQPSLPTSPDTQVINELNNAYVRGADLELLWDDPRNCLNNDGRDAQTFLYSNGILSRIDSIGSTNPSGNTGIHQRQHAKTVLIDDSLLFIGSHNWNTDSLGTASSQGSILEASIVTRNPQAIAQWLDMFNTRWEQGNPAWTVKNNSDDNDRQPCRDFSMSSTTDTLNIPRLGGNQIDGTTTGASTVKTTTVTGITITTPGPTAGTITIQQTLTLGSSATVSSVGSVSKSGVGPGITLGTIPKPTVTPSTSSSTKTITWTVPFTTSGSVSGSSMGTLSVPINLGSSTTASIATGSGSPSVAVTTTITLTTWGTKYVTCDSFGVCLDNHAVQFNVTLSALPAITGISTPFNPTRVVTSSVDPGSKTAVMTIRPDQSASPGTYVLKVRGDGAIVGTVGVPRNHTIWITINVS